jgi:O-antigen ligase
MLLMASLPFDMFYSHLILISHLVHTLIHISKNGIKPVFNLRTVALQSVFFVTLLSTIYTINRPVAFNEWGKQITIFLFPLLFCLNPLDIKKYRPQLLLSFALVCTAAILYLYFDAFLSIRHYHLPYSIILSSHFTNHNFSQPINMHATFFSMQLGIALVYLLSVLIKQRALYNKLFYLACCGILALGLLQLSSKSVIIALFIIVNAALPYFLLQGKRRLRFMLISGSFSVLIVAAILSSGTFRDRFIRDLKNDLTKSTVDEVVDSRLARWGVSTKLIIKSPVIGYGAGSEIGLLHDQYFDSKLYNSFLNRLNTHSEYLSFLLKSGIIGLTVYLFTLAFGFNASLRQKDLLFFTFMLLVAVVSISEDFLDVDKGIMFYALFFSFFIFSYENSFSSKPEVLRTYSVKDCYR